MQSTKNVIITSAFFSPIPKCEPDLDLPELRLQLHSSPKTPNDSNKKKRNRKLQTQYRESSVQTSPWQPDYVVTSDNDPEILKLEFLQWG